MGYLDDTYGSIQLPDVEQQKLLLEELRAQGKLTPEMEAALTLQDSEMNKVYTDPRLKQAQLDSLLKLQEVANNDGMTAIDKSRMNKMLSEVSQQEKGQREAVMQNMAQRGQSGSGFELAAQLANQQNAAQIASQQGMDVKAQAEERALQALMQSGQLGSQIRGQDFSEQSTKASAQDAINKFNTANKQDVQSRNVNNRNQAQKINLQEQQRIADTNSQQRNQQQQYNKELQQRKFENEMSKATGYVGAKQNADSLSYQRSKDDKNMTNQLIGTGIAAAAMAFSDENCKKNIENADIDIDAFLDSLSPKKFEYKSPKFGAKGEHLGITAQDVQKEAPQAVVNTPEGKMIDTKEASMLALASLARINDRLKKIEGK